MTFPEILAAAMEKAGSYASAGDVAEGIGGVKTWENEIQDTGRWSIYRRAVVQYGSKFWAIEYDEPATEYQEVDNADYSIYEVNPVTKIIVAYERATV